MSKNTASNKHHNDESKLSTPKLTRRSIHSTPGEKDENSFDGEVDPNSPKKKDLYPCLDKEVKEIKEQKVGKKSENIQKSGSPQKDDPPYYVPESVKITSKSSDFCNWKIILTFLSVVVSVLLFGINTLFPSEKPAADRTVDLSEFISGMKNKFEGQDVQTFQILKTSLKRVVNENSKPAAPSIVTIITNKGAEITASDFSNYIARELAYEHYVSINESTFNRNSDNLKYDIDTKIQSTFDNRSLNVAVVDKFHNIPIGAAMIFHNYCDHENAPFKRAIFLFIVHLDQRIPENPSVKFVDAAAMEALRSIWRDASDDIVDSLITRLTVNVINIK